MVVDAEEADVSTAGDGLEEASEQSQAQARAADGRAKARARMAVVAFMVRAGSGKV